MYKLTYSKNKDGVIINPNVLHDSLSDLKEIFYLTHDDVEFHLIFPDLKEEITEVFDGETLIDMIKSYKKRVEHVQIDEEGNEIIAESWVDFDFELIKTQVEQVISEHDPTPKPEPISETEKIWDTLSYLINS